MHKPWLMVSLWCPRLLSAEKQRRKFGMVRILRRCVAVSGSDHESPPGAGVAIRQRVATAMPAAQERVIVTGWPGLLDDGWFRGEGRYPLPAYSEWVPPPRLLRKPYGTVDPQP